MIKITTIYLIRHSKPLEVNNDYTNDNLQLQNEKKILSKEGENIAKEKFNSSLFSNIDCIYSSNYVRAISTAKYIAEKNNLKISIIDELGERKFGVSSWNELPKNFERKQFLDENYKIGNGESQKEVTNRVYSTIIKILNKNKNKTIAIVSHATAISYLFKLLGNIEIKNDSLIYKFQDKTIFEGIFNYCETFKLTFNDKNELLEIENIK